MSIFREAVNKIQVTLKHDKNAVTLHKDQYTFTITSRPIFLRMKNVPANTSRENQNTLHAQYGFFLNRVFCEILWKNTVEPVRPQMTIWRMHCILDTRGYKHKTRICIIIILPLPQWLHGGA